jgi:hypothetical protein
MKLITSSSKGVLPLVGNITGKVCVLNYHRLTRRYQLPRFQLFMAKGGFGCQENSLGSAVFGQYVADQKEDRRERIEFIGIASDELITRAMADDAPVMPIDLSQRRYLIVAKDGNHEFGESLKQAGERLRLITKAKAVASYLVHPETQINSMGYFSYPEGAPPEQIFGR